MRKRTVHLFVFVCLLAGVTAASPSARDGLEPVSAALRELWGRARASGADLRGLSADPVVAGGLLVTNTANVPVAGVLPIEERGALVWGDSTGITETTAIKGLAGVSPTNSGYLAVRNSASTNSFVLDGNSGLLSVAADVAEAFPAPAVAPGSVMVLDPAHPGALRLSSTPYDRRVAGVVAGAKDYRPAITLGGLDPARTLPVTLSGTTYCLASGANGPIHVGDLLTTSTIPGHAMRATDAKASQGAVLGKAMEDLRGDRGPILILASLQ
jgi:hypothetical protein